MRRVDLWRAGAATLLLLLAPPLHAQQPPAPARTDTTQPGGTAPATVVQADEARLMFEREQFTYPGRGRRDPFMPLTGDRAGPLFSDLKLHLILYVPQDPAASIVTMSDAAKKVHRLRRGDSIGNATIIDIGPTRVVFSVDDFGVRRQAVLELKAQQQGQGRELTP